MLLTEVADAFNIVEKPARVQEQGTRGQNQEEISVVIQEGLGKTFILSLACKLYCSLTTVSFSGKKTVWSYLLQSC